MTHLLVGWTVAESAVQSRRDRTLVTLAAVLPDIDGLGVIAEIATEGSDSPLYWWSDYHHVLGHNIGFGLVIVAVSALLATRRRLVALLCALAFYLHPLGDLVGSGSSKPSAGIAGAAPYARRFRTGRPAEPSHRYRARPVDRSVA